jgi:hypothetical protein
MSQNGKTKMKHKIKYAKTAQVVNVIFKVEREGEIKTSNENEDNDGLTITFARKTHNS